MLWRSASYHNLDVAAMQDMARMIDASRFAVLASSEFVWSVGRDLREMNQMAPFRLTCRRAEGGEVVWKSADLSEYSDVDLVGPPILGDGVLYIAAKSHSMMRMQQDLPRQFVLSIRPHDGKVLHRTEVGMFRQGSRYFYYYGPDSSPQPALLYRSGAVFIDTHQGILAKLDGARGEVEWGYAYPSEPVQVSYRFFIIGSSVGEPMDTRTSPPVAVGDVILIKGAKSDRLASIDPDRMTVGWSRPIARSSRLIGADDENVYLGGPELSAIDRKTQALKWATPLPGGSEGGRPIVRRDGIWQLTPRGVFELDPRTGAVRRIFRGDSDDATAVAGDLHLAGRWLVAVGNRTIAAYPRTSSAGAVGAGSASTRRGLDE
jgi:outer membrane protein assembly factor BamB